jgi:Na+-driven multidrug efflux pump
MVITQSFNGAGDTWTPTWISLFVFWLFEIPVAWVLAKQTSLAYRGGFMAITCAYGALAIVSAAIFRLGKWKTQRI